MTDLESFVANEFSRWDDALYTVFTSDFIEKYSLIHKGETKGIAVFCEKAGKWWGFFLISANMTAREGKELRVRCEKEMENRGIKEISTASVQHEVIERWHKFLGFRKESLVDIEGIPHDIWVRKWE